MGSGRRHSALIVDARAPDAGRDLIDRARRHHTAVLVVDTDDRDWTEVGAAARLAPSFTPDDLGAALDRHARPVPTAPGPIVADADPRAAVSAWRGHLVAVTGAGGVGVSTVAQGMAASLASRTDHRALVALADLALHADQAMRHDAGELVPGIQELCESHARRRPPVDVVRRYLLEVPAGGYHLLLGLRRHRDWTGVRPVALAAALDGLLRSYRVVVADIDADLEGEAETGSVDIQDRNAMARGVVGRADLAIVVGVGSTTGLHRVRRIVADLVAAGLAPARIVVVANRVPRRPAVRTGWSRALASLLRSDPAIATAVEQIGNPLFLPERRHLERAVRDGAMPGAAWCRPLATEVERRLARPAPPVDAAATAPEPEPAPIVPGSIGAWTDTAP